MSQGTQRRVSDGNQTGFRSTKEPLVIQECTLTVSSPDLSKEIIQGDPQSQLALTPWANALSQHKSCHDYYAPGKLYFTQALHRQLSKVWCQLNNSKTHCGYINGAVDLFSIFLWKIVWGAYTSMCVDLSISPERERGKYITLIFISKGRMYKQYQYLLSSFVYPRIVTKKVT